MHGKHEPTCSFCAAFVYPFEEDSPLADWGYCREEVAGLRFTLEELKEIEEQAGKGEYRFLSQGRIPLYQAWGEGCVRFDHLGHPE